MFDPAFPGQRESLLLQVSSGVEDDGSMCNCRVPAQTADELKPVHSRHQNVGYHKLGSNSLHTFECSCPFPGRTNRVAMIPKQVRNSLPVGFLVIDYHNCCHHVSSAWVPEGKSSETRLRTMVEGTTHANT